MPTPSDPSFTTLQLCKMFGLDRKLLETAIRDGLVAVPPSRQGATRRFGFWEALSLGVFAELLAEGLYRRHAAGIASALDFRLLEGREDDGRDLWMLASARTPARPVQGEEGHPGYLVNTAWVRRDPFVVVLPRIEPQAEGEEKAGRRTYFRRKVTALNLSDLIGHMRRHAPGGDLEWRLRGDDAGEAGPREKETGDE